MNNQITEQFEAILKMYKKSTLDKCSELELRQYHIFLLEHGAINGLNETTYFQLCDHIRTLLLHLDTHKKFDELKKPHKPTFRLLVLSVILTFLALGVAILSLPQVQKVFFENPQSQGKTEQSQPHEQKPPLAEPDKPKK